MRAPIVLGICLAGCATDLPPPPSVCSRQVGVLVPQSGKNKVDVLFVLDDDAPREAIARLARDVRPFIDHLKRASDSLCGALLDLHVGVITADAGGGGRLIPIGAN